MLIKLLLISVSTVLIGCGSVEVFDPSKPRNSADATKPAVNSCQKSDSTASCDWSLWEANLAKSFSLPKPLDKEIVETKKLWATYYYLPKVPTINNGYALRDLRSNPLGPLLSRKDWCAAAMEGSVYITSGSYSGRTYNYAGTSTQNTVDCSAYYKNINVSKTKFRLARGPYGDGIDSYILVPYRTIAVDPSVIPYGTVVYIPQAKGQLITLGDGSKVTHDGYFYAADTGGAIKGNHIDVFIGTSLENPFSWVKSASSGTFSAYIIQNDKTTVSLNDLHIIK